MGVIFSRGLSDENSGMNTQIKRTPSFPITSINTSHLHPKHVKFAIAATPTITLKSRVGKCSCSAEVQKPNTDYCEAGCGKPLYYCAECFRFIKMKGENCSCSWAKKKLLAKKKEHKEKRSKF